MSYQNRMCWLCLDVWVHGQWQGCYGSLLSSIVREEMSDTLPMLLTAAYVYTHCIQLYQIPLILYRITYGCNTDGSRDQWYGNARA